MIPTPAPVVRLKSRDISTSVASRALRKSYKLFKDSVDPDSLVAVLYSNMLLTPDERERATQTTETANQRLQVILMALERRISADPNVFHTLLTVLMAEPALEAVGRGMKGEFGVKGGFGFMPLLMLLQGFMTMKSREYSSSNNQTPNREMLQDVDSKHASSFSFT